MNIFEKLNNFPPLIDNQLNLITKEKYEKYN